MAAPYLPIPPMTYNYALQSVERRTTIEAALARAVFLLRKEGNGGYDDQQAHVLENLKIGEPA